MIESSTPCLADLATYRNITELIAKRRDLAPDHVAFRIEQDGALVDVTIADFINVVRDVAKGLIAVGIQPGDRIAIQGATSYAWTIADIACMWAGAVVVPIFDTSAPHQVRDILTRSKVVGAFADTHRISQDVTAQLDLGVWQLDDLGFNNLIDVGVHISDAQLEERRTGAGLDDVATLVYTSGTEGTPKGTIITHRNLIGQVLNIGASYEEVVHDGGSTLIFLPLAHVLARGLQLICLVAGMRISYEADPTKAVASLASLKPTFLVVVPRVLEKIRVRIADQARSKGLGRVWQDAEKVAIAWGRTLEQNQRTPIKPPLALKFKLAFYDRLFFAKIRNLLGGQISYLLSGAAPLDPSLNLLFRGMGLEVLEGYGLTESTAPLTGNRPGDNYAGTVGKPTPGHTVRISRDGEILARGIGISPGFEGIEDSTSFVDGFLRTGDLGMLDNDGRLTITGRLRETIVTAGGKTVAPQSWQTNVEQDPLIAHAVVVGDARPFPGAIILLDPTEAAKHGFKDYSETALVSDTLSSLILPAIRRANQFVASPERIKRITILLLDVAPGSDLVTPTMKLRRSRVIQRLSSIIDELYTSGLPV